MTRCTVTGAVYAMLDYVMTRWAGLTRKERRGLAELTEGMFREMQRSLNDESKANKLPKRRRTAPANVGVPEYGMDVLERIGDGDERLDEPSGSDDAPGDNVRPSGGHHDSANRGRLPGAHHGSTGDMDTGSGRARHDLDAERDVPRRRRQAHFVEPNLFLFGDERELPVVLGDIRAERDASGVIGDASGDVAHRHCTEGEAGAGQGPVPGGVRTDGSREPVDGPGQCEDAFPADEQAALAALERPEGRAMTDYPWWVSLW